MSALKATLKAEEEASSRRVTFHGAASSSGEVVMPTVDAAMSVELRSLREELETQKRELHRANVKAQALPITANALQRWQEIAEEKTRETEWYEEEAAEQGRQLQELSEARKKVTRLLERLFSRRNQFLLLQSRETRINRVFSALSLNPVMET